MSLRTSLALALCLVTGCAGCAAGTEDDGAPASPAVPSSDGGTSTEDTRSTAPDDETSAPDDSGSPTPPSDAPSTPGSYPAGPYGKALGDVIPNLSWKGYRNGTGAWTDIALADYYDPTGKKGIRAIKLELAAIWCEVCNTEAGAMRGKYAGYYARGARFLTALTADTIGVKATQATVDKWIGKYACDYDVSADPAWSFAPKGEGSSSMPYGLLLDPRTMKIVEVYPGYSPAILSHVDTLISKNGG